MAWTVAMRERADNMDERSRVHQEPCAECRRLKAEQDAVAREERPQKRLGR